MGNQQADKFHQAHRHQAGNGYSDEIKPGDPFLARRMKVRDEMAQWTAVFFRIMNHDRHVASALPSLKKMVGAGRFELPTSCTPSKRASRTTLRPEPLNYWEIAGFWRIQFDNLIP